MGCIETKKKNEIKSIERTAAKTLQSIVSIQCWFRACRARMELRRRAAWLLLQFLEKKTEQEQINEFHFYNALLAHTPPYKNIKLCNIMENSHQNDFFTNISDVKLLDEPTITHYIGPIINFPLNNHEVLKLIDFFRMSNSTVLHPKFVCSILSSSAMRLKTLENFNVPQHSHTSQITICGSLHGSLADLLVIFYKNGLPSSENPYIFNGDFVDHGKCGLEVLLLLLATFLAYPGAVHLNRGNHEDFVVNKRYGFAAEVIAKYGTNAKLILRLINEVFRWLPLGTLVHNRVLIVHGGITSETDLKKLQQIKRGKYVSVLRPPYQEDFNKNDWKQIFDLLWNDSASKAGCTSNERHGTGTFFGKHITRRFLRKNKLILLVRSHECKANGFEMCHSSKVITLFSASNYFSLGSNKGAYLKLNKEMKLFFVRFISSASKITEMTPLKRLVCLEQAAVHELGVRLHELCDILAIEFRKVDPFNIGAVDLYVWCDLMANITGMSLPWELLINYLASKRKTSDGRVLVDYRQSLALLNSKEVKTTYREQKSRIDMLIKDKETLEAIFHFINADNSGYIRFEEFKKAWEQLKMHIPRELEREDVFVRFNAMDANKDGLVDLHEFVESFQNDKDLSLTSSTSNTSIDK